MYLNDGCCHQDNIHRGLSFSLHADDQKKDSVGLIEMSQVELQFQFE